MSSLDLGRVTSLITSLLADVLSLVTVLALVLFSAMDARGFSDTLARLETERPAFVAAMTSFTRGTRQYRSSSGRCCSGASARSSPFP